MPARPLAPPIEAHAAACAQAVVKYIHRHRGQFLRSDDGSLHVVLGTECIPLSPSPTNLSLARLLTNACGIGSLSLLARLTIERVQLSADVGAGPVQLRRFSAFQGDTLYVPLEGGLLRVGRDGLRVLPNGAGGLWVEHPCGEPMRLPLIAGTPPSIDVTESLGAFERLLIETQACALPAMRWFVGMHEAFLPFVRDQLPARFVLLHQGASQSGKTSGAQRFCKLLGLGDVKGDYSVAALGNLADIGLLVLDNREQADFDRGLVNFFLFLATGAQRGRSDADGNLRVSGTRPIGVITTIEGVAKEELRRRCVPVTYSIAGAHLPRHPLETEIAERRHSLLLAMMHVFQRYIEIRTVPVATPDPIPEFGEHFSTLATLLRAYGCVSGREDAWAESLIGEWALALERREQDEDEDELEFLIMRAITENLDVEELDLVEWRGRPGRVYVTQTASLLVALQQLGLRDVRFPRTPSGLSRRLRSTTFRSIAVLDPSSDLPELRRRADHRPLGLFVPAEVGGMLSDAHRAVGFPRGPFKLLRIDHTLSTGHAFLTECDECYYLWPYLSESSVAAFEGAPSLLANEFLRAFQIPPGARTNPTRWRRKQLAIRYGARALAETLPPEWRKSGTFVPMPPSRPEGDPDHDSRVLDMLRRIGPELDVRNMLSLRAATASKAKGVSPAERAANLLVDEDLSEPPPKLIVVVDDLVTSGSHFKAAQLTLERPFPGVRVIGLFLSRTVRSGDLART